MVIYAHLCSSRFEIFEDFNKTVPCEVNQPGFPISLKKWKCKSNNYVCYLWIQSIFSTLYLRKVFYHFPINPAVTPILDFQLLKRKCQAFCKGPLKKHSTYVCCKWFFILKYFFKIDTNVQLGQCWRLSLISNCINSKNKNCVKQSYFIHVMIGG